MYIKRRRDRQYYIVNMVHVVYYTLSQFGRQDDVKEETKKAIHSNLRIHLDV